MNNNCEDNVATSKGAMSNKAIDMIPLRVSSRIKDRPKKYWGNNRHRRIDTGTDGNHFLRKTNAGSRSIDSNDSSIVFDQHEFRNILKIKELFRRTNISKQQSKEVNVDQKNMSELKGHDLIMKLRQAATNANEVHFDEGEISKRTSYPHLVCRDLSNGLEAVPIPVINEFDDSPITPLGFTYITSNQVAENVEVPSNDDYGCQCKGSCTNRKNCCIRLNTKLPYSRRRKCSRLIQAKDILFECGPRCGCAPDCFNRVSQRGLQYRLEIYRTPNKGWGVRTLDFIPFGAFVCELVGVLKRTEDLDDASNNEYIVEIDCWETLKEIAGRKKRLPNEKLPAKIFLGKEDDDETTNNDPEFCIDCSSSGNVARFINHSCKPTLFVQCVLDSHYGVKQARIALFAGEAIRPNQELTYDYGCQLDSVVDADGNIKQLPCYCGESTCRKRVY